MTVALAGDDRIADPGRTAMAIVGVWRGLQVLLIAGDPLPSVDSAHTVAMQALLPAYPGPGRSATGRTATHPAT